MPVKSDSGSINTNDFEEESTDQGVDEALGLLGSSDGTMCPVVQSTNSECSGSGGGEGQPLLDDVVSAERNDEEYTEETSSNGKSDQFSGVLLRGVREKVERIHGRDGRNK